MSVNSRPRYRFADFELDLAKRRLLKNGEAVALKPKAFDLLAVLVGHNGELLTKEDLFRLVWGDQIVEETNLSVSISAIRKALGESASDPRFITNVSGRGYYFDAELIPDEEVPGEVVVESHSFSRIVVEDEEDDDEDTATSDRQPPQLPGASRSSLVPAMIGAAIVAVVVLAAYFLYFRIPKRPFQPLSVSRITNNGRAPRAAIAPDGKSFVYLQADQDGNESLWLSQIDGGGQIKIVPSFPLYVTGLTFSPNGQNIYYVLFERNMPGTGTLYRIPALGGVPERIRDGVASRVAFSPDGSEYAFPVTDEAARSSKVVAVSVDSNNERELTKIDTSRGSFTAAIDWSPDGSTIAVGTVLRNSDPPTAEVFTIDPRTGSTQQLTKENWETIRSLAWAKDNDGIVICGDGPAETEKQIWLLPYPSGEPSKILSDGFGYGSLDIANDNTMIATQSMSYTNIWVAPSDDLASARQVTFDLLGRYTGGNSIDWTPDDHILYTALTSGVDQIWEMKSDGSGQRQLVPGNKTTEYLSAPDDGRFIVFMSTRGGGFDIWRSERDGSGMRQLTTGGYNDDPHVSPDGSFIIYNSGRGSDSRLHRIPSDGGAPVKLNSNIAGWARISPDSKLIACGYQVDGKLQLAIIPAEGGDPLKIFEVPRSTIFRLSVRWTPDGRYVTYRSSNGIWKQDINGGEPVRIGNLPNEKLFAYAWSRDGKQFAYARGKEITDTVLLTSLK